MCRLRYFLATAVASFALVACGESTLDVDPIENEIAPEVERRTGTKDVDVDCPDNVEAKEGDTFDCDVTAEGGIQARVEVTQEDDEGNVIWELVQP